MSTYGITVSKPRRHPEGWAIDVHRGETKLATAYGADPAEADARAAIIVIGFQQDATRSMRIERRAS